jgi:hypothetical protein
MLSPGRRPPNWLAGLALLPVGGGPGVEDRRQRVVPLFAVDVFVVVVFGAKFAA